MAVSKDIEKGTWTSQVWVEDWQGKKKHKKKRGFATKKEALEWEHSILLAAKADMSMKLADFVDLYFRDKETELKARTVRNKRYMIEQHVVPMLGDKPMDGITPVDIIQWQNYIRSKGFKETYQRMLQNQLTALFTHATKIYNLKDNPCAKVKRIGKADADKKQLQFWTLDEFNKFIATFEERSRYHVLFDLLFYSGCRICEALALTPKDFDVTNRKVSITKTIPINTKSNSCLVKIAIAPSVAPKAKDPVSPINILAGFILNKRNPNNAPAIIKQTYPISIYPTNQVVL